TLPLPLTRFFGRRQELERLLELLQAPDVRLVTVLGPGGAGKTRLSIEVAHRLAPLLPERIGFVSLAELPHANLLPSALLRALRLPANAQTDPLDQVASALGGQPYLLLLDNFEHLLGEEGEAKYEAPRRTGAVPVRMLLERIPSLRCLVTSRQALRLEGEQTFVLPPLALPALDTSASPETLIANESVALYLDRARLARPDFALNASNAEAIRALCRKLEGMPLALEMAAAWAKALPVGKVLERLERQLDLLVSRRSDLPARHQSLRATIEWSFDLLSPELREAFACISVFRGGWSLEAAEAVIGDEALGLLAELQERSLIVMEERGEEVRYRMLETLRQFGQEKLEERGQARALWQRHAAYFTQWAEGVGKRMDRADQRHWLDQVEVEYDNLLQVLAWCEEEPGQAETGLLLCSSALGKYWNMRGHLTEGRFWYHRMLNAAGPTARTKARATVLVNGGIMAFTQGDYASARTGGEQGLEIFREIGDRSGMGGAFLLLGRVYHALGDIAMARTRYEEALALQREAGKPLGLARALNALGFLLREEGDFAAARAYLEEGLALCSKLEAGHDMASILNNLFILAWTQGDYTLARRRLEEALAISREVGHRPGEATFLNNLGEVASFLGDYAAAQDYLEQSLNLHRETGNRQECASALNNLGKLARTRGDYAQARTYYEEALILSQEAGYREVEANTFRNLGTLARVEGDYPSAKAWYARCLTIQRELNNPVALVRVLEYLVSMAAAQADPSRLGTGEEHTPSANDLLRCAARLGGAAEAIREQFGAPLEPTRRKELEQEIVAAREQLGEAKWAETWAEGRQMTRQQALDYALSAMEGDPV
ncbi:MAG TPA: tetratricopeptide repeat protein, partial [Chthonomonadaceae bacterium]|nr:tetratricopeptide repeat protein [Chthonomonadaceae bacterium]